MRIVLDLEEFSVVSLGILERSARMNAKRLRWGIGGRRVVSRVLAEVAAQLRREIQRRLDLGMVEPLQRVALAKFYEESGAAAGPKKTGPGGPLAEAIELGEFTPWESKVLHQFFEEETSVYLAMRQQQEQTPAEAALSDLKACAVQCAQFDQALAAAFEAKAD